MKQEERSATLEDVYEKQASIISLITGIVDKYGEHKESGLLVQNLRNASDQLHKINLSIATGDMNIHDEQIQENGIR